MSERPDLPREALRQQQLIRVLWRRAGEASLAEWLRGPAGHAVLGVAAYRGNAAAVAERALAQAFPTVRQLLGEESFAMLARAFWHRCVPLQGDLAQLGAELPGFVEGDPQLAGEPYLADVARVDWAVHCIEQADDVDAPPPGLQRLAGDDRDRIRLVLRPGIAALRSSWPVARIWHAHRSERADRFAQLREDLARGAPEDVLVWRDGWRGVVEAVAPAPFAFTQALLDDSTLGDALRRAGDAFSFERWLHDALARRWLVTVTGPD
jgi:hypothetical protein